MALTYTLNPSGTSTMAAARKGTFRFGVYTFTQRRGYMQFDMSGEGLSLGDVDFVKLHNYCHVVFNAGHEYFVRSADSGDANWGPTLVAANPDFVSTAAHLEDSKTISGTGAKIWDVDKNNIDFSGITYARITSKAPGNGSNNRTQYRTQNYGTASQRPFLRFTLAAGGVVIVPSLPLLGVGLG